MKSFLKTTPTTAVVLLFTVGICFTSRGQSVTNRSATNIVSTAKPADPAKPKPEANSEIRSLLNNLQSTNTETRLFAIQAIGNLGPKATAAVNPLTSLLSDKNSSVRILTAQALGKIGANAKGALPALGKLSESGSLSERSMANLAIKKINQ